MIRYELIGTHPEVNHLASNLPTVISVWENLRTRAAKHHIGGLIARAAAHFYGFALDDFGSMHALVSAVRAADQRLQVS